MIIIHSLVHMKGSMMVAFMDYNTTRSKNLLIFFKKTA